MRKMNECKLFGEYIQSFDKREPNLQRLEHNDELQKFSEVDGVREFCYAPIYGIEIGKPPIGMTKRGDNTYLWVITDEGIPYLLEEGNAGRSLNRGRASHTNLTGNQEAYCGGEIWFAGEDTVWISGGSSRFQPRDSNELNTVQKLFEACNYKVTNFGWDDETDRPVRFMREV